MKLIDMEKALSELCLSHKDIIYIDKNETAERIRKIPSIDIEPKRGGWKRMKFTDCGLPVDKCSICGHYINGDVEVRNYCPNCGARMKGADDE